MKRIVLLLLLLPLPAIEAQHLSDYTLSVEVSNAYHSISTTGTPISFYPCAPGSQSIQYDQHITMPFDFEFGTLLLPQGANITVSPAGRIAFNTNSVYSQGYFVWNTPPANEQNIWPFLCGERGQIPTGSGCWYQVMPDDQGGQMLVIEWKGMKRWAIADDNFNLQLWLHDNGDVSAHYGPMYANPTHYDTLFSFLMVAGNAQSAGHYIDRVMLDGTWNAPAIVTESTFPPFGYVFQGNFDAYMSGVPDSGLLLTYKRPPLPCPNPMNIAVRAIGAEWATIGWDASNPADSGSVAYVLEYDTVQFTPGTGVHNPTSVGDSVVTLNSLFSNRHYYFYVKAQCSSDSSRWRGIEFETPCTPMSHADLPYAFPSGGSTLPPCWRKLGHVSVSTTGTGTQLYVQHDSNSVAIFPMMDYVNDLRLDFDHTWNPVTVGVMTNPTDISTFIPVAEIPLENTQTSHTVSLRRYRGAGQFVALRGQEGNYGCNLRNLILYAYTGCQPVEDLTVAALTPSTADIVWSDPDEVGSYRVVWWLDGGTSADSVTVTDTVVTLTGLMIDTDYVAVVRTLCTDGTAGPADTVWFRPGCVPPSNVVADSLTGYAARLRWHDNFGAGTYIVNLYNADSTLMQHDTVVGDTAVWIAGLAPRTAYLAGVSRLCPSGWTDEVFGSFITDFGCAEPDSVAISGVTDSNATITIHDSIGLGPYVLLITSDGITDTLYSDTSVVVITGLSASSRYDLSVGTVCADSTWSAPVPLVFETPCAVISHIDLPYVQTFDQCTYNDRSTLPPCWMFYDFRPSNHIPSYRPDSQQHRGATGLSLHISPQSNAEPGFIVLPEVDSLADLVLNFWVYCTWAGDDRVDVGVMSDPTDTATFTPLQSYTPAVRDEWVQLEVPLGSYTGTGRYPALRCGVNGTTFGDPLYFDDITLRVNLSCERPDSLYVSNLAPTSATLNIIPSSLGDSAASYQVILGSYYGTDTLLLTTDHWMFTALRQATDYTVTVRSVCADGELTLPALLEFTTPCGPYTLPWFDDFEHHDYYRLARCWEVMDSASKVPVVRWVRPLPYSGENQMEVSLRDSGSFSIFASPELAPCDGPAALSVMVKMYDFASLADTMPCNLKISLLHGDSLTELYVVKTIFADWTPVEVVAPMGMLAYGGRFVFTFTRAVDTSWSSAFLALDDIMVSPACLPVEGLEVVSVDTIPEGLEAHWQPQGVESQWEVEIMNPSFDTVFTVTAPVCALTGDGLLADSTGYLLAVRPVCAEGDTGGWSDTIVFRTPDPVGIIPVHQTPHFSIYPNPASEKVMVVVGGIDGETTVEVLDVTGRIVAKHSTHSAAHVIDVSSFAPGAYFLRVQGCGAVGKLVVE